MKMIWLMRDDLVDTAVCVNADRAEQVERQFRARARSLGARCWAVDAMEVDGALEFLDREIEEQADGEA